MANKLIQLEDGTHHYRWNALSVVMTRLAKVWEQTKATVRLVVRSRPKLTSDFYLTHFLLTLKASWKELISYPTIL